METLPLISVVTVTFNSERWLRQTIESVRDQKYPNLQYVLIDGGSTDRTLEIVDEYRELFDVILSERDQGISDAMNKGILRCRGELIGLIHSDDWYEPGCFQKVVETYLASKAQVIHGNVRYWVDEKPAYVHTARQECLKEEMTINHPSCFVERGVYEEFGVFGLHWKYAMDYELFLRYVIKGVRFEYIPQTLANMRHEGISERRWIQAFYEVCKIRRLHLKSWFWPYLGFLRSVVRFGTGRLLSRLGLEGVKAWYRKKFAKVPKTLE